MFAPLVATGAVVGDIPVACAEPLGLETPVVMVAGGFDQAMATLGTGIVGPGIVHLGLGSWAALTALAADRPADAPMRTSGLSIGPSVAGDARYAVMGSSAGGIVPAWLGTLAGPGSDTGPRRIAQLAARAPDRPTGLLGLSHLEGSYTPWLDPASRGAIAGLGLATDASILARGLLEAVAYELREIVARLRAAGLGVDSIRVERRRLAFADLAAGDRRRRRAANREGAGTRCGSAGGGVLRGSRARVLQLAGGGGPSRRPIRPRPRAPRPSSPQPMRRLPVATPCSTRRSGTGALRGRGRASLAAEQGGDEG